MPLAWSVATRSFISDGTAKPRRNLVSTTPDRPAREAGVRTHARRNEPSAAARSRMPDSQDRNSAGVRPAKKRLIQG